MSDYPGRAAVILPGGVGGPYAPLPLFAGEAAENRGAEIHRVSWSAAKNPRDLTDPERTRWVAEQVAPVLANRSPLLIGKSLGTHAAPIAAQRALPAVWLTPLLLADEVVSALRRATAPFLLVGGTDDPTWNSALARSLTPYVLEVADADHGMFVPGPLAASAAVLGTVVTAVEQFLDDVVWPDHKAE
jgi:hypothetical protein